MEAQHQQMWVGGEKYLVSGKPGTVGEHIRRSLMGARIQTQLEPYALSICLMEYYQVCIGFYDYCMLE